MELWIRSQDKERIIKTNQLDIMEFDTDVDPRYNHFGVYANEYLVGEYKTKERALEVLDEIQEVLCPKILMMKPNSQITLNDGVNIVLPDNCSYERIGDTYVFEMPEK